MVERIGQGRHSRRHGRVQELPETAPSRFLRRRRRLCQTGRSGQIHFVRQQNERIREVLQVEEKIQDTQRTRLFSNAVVSLLQSV